MRTSDSVHELVRDCLALRVRLVGRVVSNIYDKAIVEHGVTIAQVNLLAALGRIGPCAPAKLVAALHLDRSTASRNLDLLRKRDLVETLSADAKGAREVALTPGGRQKLVAILPAWRGAQKQASALIGQAGTGAFRKSADRIWSQTAD